MTYERLTRRQFVRDTAAGAAALAAGAAVANIVKVGNAEQADTASILNYSSDMEYRSCGIGRLPGRSLETGQQDGARRGPGQ